MTVMPSPTRGEGAVMNAAIRWRRRSKDVIQPLLIASEPFWKSESWSISDDKKKGPQEAKGLGDET
jgi:hypothetical protein